MMNPLCLRHCAPSYRAAGIPLRGRSSVANVLRVAVESNWQDARPDLTHLPDLPQPGTPFRLEELFKFHPTDMGQRTGVWTDGLQMVELDPAAAPLAAWDASIALHMQTQKPMQLTNQVHALPFTANVETVEAAPDGFVLTLEDTYETEGIGSIAFPQIFGPHWDFTTHGVEALVARFLGLQRGIEPWLTINLHFSPLDPGSREPATLNLRPLLGALQLAGYPLCYDHLTLAADMCLHAREDREYPLVQLQGAPHGHIKFNEYHVQEIAFEGISEAGDLVVREWPESFLLVQLEFACASLFSTAPIVTAADRKGFLGLTDNLTSALRAAYG